MPDHMFLGTGPGGKLVLLHESHSFEHGLVVGASGSGKTTLAILAVLVQWMRGLRVGEPPRAAAAIDNKGDSCLLNTMRLEAEARGQDFLTFTMDGAPGSHRFNFFQTVASRERAPVELATILLQALGLDHGDGYGASWFQSENMKVLRRALRQEGTSDSFRTLFSALRRTRGSSGTEIYNRVEILADYESLHPRREDEGINFHRALERREAVYFWLPLTAAGAPAARDVARLAMWAILDAAEQRMSLGLSPSKALVVLDEAHLSATRSMARFLEQARSFGIGALLGVQSTAGFEAVSKELLSSVITNTAYKVYLSLEEADLVRELQVLGGDIPVIQSSVAIGTSGTTVSFREVMTPRLPPNLLGQISDQDGAALVHIRGSRGLARAGYWPVMLQYCMSKEEYTRRLTAWPFARRQDQALPAPSAQRPPQGTLRSERAERVGALAAAILQREHEELERL